MKRLPLHAICPYFAMFPESFVREQVLKYTKEGDLVFDPFCGRGTTILESLLLGRQAAGSDINPVAYCVSAAKAHRPAVARVERRLDELEAGYRRGLTRAQQDLPPFFRMAFHPATLAELLYLRRNLAWKRNHTDRFVAALVLGSLHGEMDKSSAYFSNQMPRTICLKPDYSLRYWRKHGLRPSRRRVFEMLRSKATLRLKDVPDCGRGSVRLTDARAVADRFPSLANRVSLVVTSPPYLRVTRYEEDQWLRLWFLGGPPEPTYGRISTDDRHDHASRYWTFLAESLRGLSPLLKSGAILVIRLGALGLDTGQLLQGLRQAVAQALETVEELAAPTRSEIVNRQAQVFLPTSKGCQYEMDFTYRITT